VKIAVVVQRYGADINGGAELHARYVAEHLARHISVEVITTCASDYITWRNDRASGTESVHGITVRRFPVSRERTPDDFGAWSARVFTRPHSVNDELAWLEAEGPTSPALVDYLRAHEADYDFFIFFSARYYHAYHGARAVAHKAILVPTAERDGALGLSIFGPLFRGARALMYNSYEERSLIQGITGNHEVPGVVVGIGSDIPERPRAARFRQKFGMHDRFAIYVGRIDENKGCRELFDFFIRYSTAMLDGLHLVLIGNPIIPIPSHPRIHHLGFVSDQDKFDAMAAADLLVMPSYFESLSMVALEAWALGRPVLANAACDVLQGQCRRSNAGLYYHGYPEFLETLRAIDMNPALAAALGTNGQRYFQTHYSWPVIERKYLDMLERLSHAPAGRGMDALPGWFGRRRRTLPPADLIVNAQPRGAATDISEQAAGRPRPTPSRSQAPAAPAAVPARTAQSAPAAPAPVAAPPQNPTVDERAGTGGRNDRRADGRSREREPRQGQRGHGQDRSRRTDRDTRSAGQGTRESRTSREARSATAATSADSGAPSAPVVSSRPTTPDAAATAASPGNGGEQPASARRPMARRRRRGKGRPGRPEGTPA
jgi:glycosyltransferase involved in cell wall biosynthesis